MKQHIVTVMNGDENFAKMLEAEIYPVACLKAKGRVLYMWAAWAPPGENIDDSDKFPSFVFELAEDAETMQLSLIDLFSNADPSFDPSLVPYLIVEGMNISYTAH